MTTEILIPSPLPTDLRTGIVHLGFGAFHRAHQADYTQDAIALSGGDWGIEAVTMRNPALGEALNANDGAFTLLIKAPSGPRLKQVTSVRKAWCLADAPEIVADRIADPAIHIVTMTVTEKAYGADTVARRLNRADPVVAHDLANPDRPKGLIGILVAGLRLRQSAGTAGMTIMSCDNLPDNGKLLRNLVLEFASIIDPTLEPWIGANCTFPSSMVDRITPASSTATFAFVEQVLGHPDPVATETEPFRQWVIEDAFAGPRPAWEKAGVLIVADVAPFETMKLRMLNGAHSLIAYLGTTGGFACVRDVMAVPEFRALIARHMDTAAATLPALAGFDPVAYRDALIERFENRAIDHRCIQIAMDGSQKLPQRIFAPARQLVDTGGSFGTFALATALWMHHIGGTSNKGEMIPLSDPLAEALRPAVVGEPVDAVRKLGAVSGLDGRGLFENPMWLEAVAIKLAALRDMSLDAVVATEN
jgi:fructuronate reductase